MDRRRFIQGLGLSGAGMLTATSTAMAQAETKGAKAASGAPLQARPYQFLCAICSLGADPAKPSDATARALLDALKQDPDRPVTIVCNAGDAYSFQDPGLDADTPEGRDFNRKRDLDILQKMSWAPGITLPARGIFLSLLKAIPSVTTLCGYPTVTSEGWRGCSKAKNGYYEKGVAKGIDAIIPPRSEQEMTREKAASLLELRSGKAVKIRPHILLCAVCQYGEGARPPFKADNLPELLDMVLHQNPDVPVTMVRGSDCWMICAPCPAWVPSRHYCVNVLGSGGLSNEKRDLDTLQKLGLHFGSTMKARDLFPLIFQRIPTTQEICRRDGNTCPCVWWDGCGESNVKQGNPNYEKGRRELIEKFKALQG